MRIALLISAAGLALGHHSFAGEFDEKKPVSLRGQITKVDWGNPHVFLYLDAVDEDGNVTHWKLETGSPNALARSGWTRDYFKPGDPVAVGGFQARDGSNYASALQVRRKNGVTMHAPPEPK